MSTLGEKIKEARKSLKDKNGKFPSQEDFAERIGLKSYQAISKYETDAQDPPIETLRQIAKVTGKPVSWFFDEESSTPEIKTVKDVIEAVERLESVFHAYSDVELKSYGYEDTRTQTLELTFDIPRSYKAVFDQIKTIRDLSVNMPDEARNAWYKVLMEEQSKVSVYDMLTEEK